MRNDLPDGPPNPSGGRPDVWEALISEDETKIDAELLAAYAEGRLNPPRRQALRKEIASSPSAMEILNGLSQLRPQEQPLAQRDALRANSLTNFSWRTLALAASVLIATGVSLMLMNSRRQVGKVQNQIVALRAELEERTSQLNLTRVEHAALLSGRRPLMVGPMSPRLVRLAMKSTAARGIERTAEKQSQLDEILNEARVASAEVASDTAALELLAGKADDIIVRLGDAAISNLSPEQINQLAAAYAVQSDELIPAEAQGNLEKAEQLLKGLTDISANFAPAWFNLAVIKTRLSKLLTDPVAKDQKQLESQNAWREYVRHEQRSELREIVDAEQLERRE